MVCTEGGKQKEVLTEIQIYEPVEVKELKEGRICLESESSKKEVYSEGERRGVRNSWKVTYNH